MICRCTTKWDKAASTATQFCSWTVSVIPENNETGSPEVTKSFHSVKTSTMTCFMNIDGLCDFISEASVEPYKLYARSPTEVPSSIYTPTSSGFKQSWERTPQKRTPQKKLYRPQPRNLLSQITALWQRNSATRSFGPLTSYHHRTLRIKTVSYAFKRRER